MRRLAVIFFALMLVACQGPATENPIPQAVDVSSLPPLTSQEQALIFGADGAAQQGNFAAAERDYLSAAAASKGRTEAHIALARLYEKDHRSQQERDILQRALQFQPHHPLANYLLGKLDLEENRYADALEAFRQGRQARPDDIDLSTGEAIANDMLGNHAAAQLVYLRTLKQNPDADLSTVRTDLAMSYLLSNRPKEAILLLKTEMAKPNPSPVVRHNLALAYGLLGKNSEAKTVLNGEIDEETRQLALARLQEYLQTGTGAAPPSLKPLISPAAPRASKKIGEPKPAGL